ncbi:TPA: hypothetical protein NEG48_001093 [Elizabethkingia anophelis]|nr:hypothetical protein [Elizabethkingia anophelis]
MQKEEHLQQKKRYESPEFSVIEVEMEEGIASGSATVSPGVDINGNTDAVNTDWGGSDTTTIDTPF